MTRGAKVVAAGVAAAFATLAAAGAGGLLGALAARLHPHQPAPGGAIVLGLASGVAVGAAWAVLMRRVARARPADVATWGTVGGLAAGALPALAVHAAIALRAPSAHALRVLLTGQVFGLGAGAILGCLGGLVWKVALLRSPGARARRVAALVPEALPAGARRGATLRPWLGRLAEAVVLLAAGAMSALLGRRLGQSYRWDFDVHYLHHPLAVTAGTWLGAAAGLAAGAGWIGWMRRCRTGDARDALLARGVRAGFVAGALATAALQLGLEAAFSWRDALARQLLGQLLALGPSLLLGLAGGALRAAASARRARQGRPPPPRGPDIMPR